jgi:hypothetical protein
MGVFSQQKKYEVFKHLKDFKAHTKKQSGRTMKITHKHNGGDYVNKYVQHLFDEVGI